MKTFDRRKFFILLSSAGLLSACGVKSKLLDTVSIDNQVENTLQFLYNKWPQVLLFMTGKSLTKFKNSSGFNLSADFTYALQADAYTLGVDIMSSTAPIIPIVFAQGGLIGGISLEGTKYNKLAK